MMKAAASGEGNRKKIEPKSSRSKIIRKKQKGKAIKPRGEGKRRGESEMIYPGLDKKIGAVECPYGVGSLRVEDNVVSFGPGNPPNCRKGR